MVNRSVRGRQGIGSLRVLAGTGVIALALALALGTSAAGAALPAAQQVDLAARSSTGAFLSEYAVVSAISANGRFVAFNTGDNNVVPGQDADGPIDWDGFVRDVVTGQVELVGRSTGGTEADAVEISDMSANGRFILFQSSDDNLSPDDNDSFRNFYRHDRVTGVTVPVTMQSGMTVAANGDTNAAVISPDGRFVAFTSEADNLSNIDDNSLDSVFLRDVPNETTDYVSPDSSGASGPDASSRVRDLTDTGTVVFESAATDIVSPDGNGSTDVFLRPLGGPTSLVSRNSAGVIGADSSEGGSISANGKLVAFHSVAANMAGDDVNGVRSVYLRNVATGTTTVVSRRSGQNGAPVADGYSSFPIISSDGRAVAFSSGSTTLGVGSGDPAQVFIRDLALNTTRLASRGSGSRGAAAAGGAELGALSAGGSYVGFQSADDSLAPGAAGNLLNGYLRSMKTPRCAGRVATLVGTQRADILRGSRRADAIVALGGRDRIRSLTGNDRVCAGHGRDFVNGGGGRDLLLGEGGADLLLGGSGRDVLRGGPGRDRLRGGPGRDRLRGGPGRDRLRGGPGRDVERQ